MVRGMGIVMGTGDGDGDGFTMEWSPRAGVGCQVALRTPGSHLDSKGGEFLK